VNPRQNWRNDCWREKEQIWEVVGRERMGKGEEDAVDTK